MPRFTEENPKLCIFEYSCEIGKNCSVCGSFTMFYEDVGTDNPLCSDECYEKWWKEYFKALEVSDRLDAKGWEDIRGKK